MASYKTSRIVQFRDTDAAGIMHFSTFFVRMEEAEHEFLRSLGTSVMTRDDQGAISWPRVSATCQYTGAVRFEDELQIELGIERLGEKSVTYRIKFRRDDEQVAEGALTAVCCRLDEGRPPQSMAIPADLRAKLQSYVWTAQ